MTNRSNLRDPSVSWCRLSSGPHWGVTAERSFASPGLRREDRERRKQQSHRERGGQDQQTGFGRRFSQRYLPLPLDEGWHAIKYYVASPQKHSPTPLLTRVRSETV